jgi:hypothetical protein
MPGHTAIFAGIPPDWGHKAVHPLSVKAGAITIYKFPFNNFIHRIVFN